MKRALIACALVAALALPAGAALAQTGPGDETIRSFDSSVTVDADASVNVVETIAYDFGQDERHGIYRDIPVTYALPNGGTETLDLQDVAVTDENGDAYPFTLGWSGAYRRIKIGDPNVLVTGDHTYVISYTAPSMVGFFQNYDEVYWNATGDLWQVPVEKATADVRLAFASTTVPAILSTSCYQGTRGSTEPCPVAAVSTDQAGSPYAHFESRPLAPGEGLTVAVAFPKGFVTKPLAAATAAHLPVTGPLGGWWLLIIPVITFSVSFTIWYKKGRAPKAPGPVIAQYEAPDGLTPLQCKLMISESVSSSFAAEIVYLATLGYLRISRTERKALFMRYEDHMLTKLQEADASLSPHLALLLNDLFESATDGTVRLSKLSGSFYARAYSVLRQAEDSLISGGYLKPSRFEFLSTLRSNSVLRNRWTGAFSIITIAGMGGIWIYARLFAAGMIGISNIFAISWAVAVASVAFFVLITSRYTQKGVAIRQAVKGLRLYLSVAEKDRIAFHDAPAKDPQTFQKSLPYAMALGVEKEWAKVFEGIDMPPPGWYTDPSLSGFNAAIFLSSMHAFSTAATSELSHAPGSSSGSFGGGFSGGGGGGGGGGSW